MDRYTNCTNHFGKTCYNCKKEIKSTDDFIVPYGAIIMHSSCWGRKK